MSFEHIQHSKSIYIILKKGGLVGCIAPIRLGTGTGPRKARFGTGTKTMVNGSDSKIVEDGSDSEPSVSILLPTSTCTQLFLTSFQTLDLSTLCLIF